MAAAEEEVWRATRDRRYVVWPAKERSVSNGNMLMKSRKLTSALRRLTSSCKISIFSSYWPRSARTSMPSGCSLSHLCSFCRCSSTASNSSLSLPFTRISPEQSALDGSGAQSCSVPLDENDMSCCDNDVDTDELDISAESLELSSP